MPTRFTSTMRRGSAIVGESPAACASAPNTPSSRTRSTSAGTESGVADVARHAHGALDVGHPQVDRDEMVDGRRAVARRHARPMPLAAPVTTPTAHVRLLDPSAAAWLRRYELRDRDALRSLHEVGADLRRVARELDVVHRATSSLKRERISSRARCDPGRSGGRSRTRGGSRRCHGARRAASDRETPRRRGSPTRTKEHSGHRARA